MQCPNHRPIENHPIFREAFKKMFSANLPPEEPGQSTTPEPNPPEDPRPGCADPTDPVPKP
jgi:hypothetical protein